MQPVRWRVSLGLQLQTCRFKSLGAPLANLSGPTCLPVQMPLVVAGWVQALDMVRENGLTLEHLIEFQTCPRVVEPDLRQNGLTLQFASKFQMVEGMVLLAVQQDGLALTHLWASIWSPSLVLEAVKQNGLALQ